MSVKVVLGLQNGDEGKGRVIDDLVHNATKPVVVRFQGGNNAGHTIYDPQGQKYVVHGLPSGVLNPNAINIITRGCVVNPDELSMEIAQFKVEQGTLIISEYCPTILPHHVEIDKAVYQGRLGTTAKGIGPAYAAHTSRDATLLKDWVPEEGENYLIQSYIGNAEKALRDFITEGYDVFLEGCQGVRLDLWGDEYPNVTSSCTTIGAVLSSTRLNHKDIDTVIGVAKVYETKVGNGDFIELHNELAEDIRQKGKEYGSTTGRPRKIGWTDLDQLKEACQVNGVDILILTKTDVISQVGVLNVWVDKELVEFKVWGTDCSIDDPNLFNFLEFVKRYTGVKEIGYTYGERRGSIKLIVSTQYQ